jgi:hypothetical protein
MTTNQETRQAHYCSREWGLKKEAVHKRSNGVCERCKKNKGQAVHHKTYIRLYNERLEDLIHLCNGCHDFEHGKSNIDPINENYCSDCGWNFHSCMCTDITMEYFSRERLLRIGKFDPIGPREILNYCTNCGYHHASCLCFIEKANRK